MLLAVDSGNTNIVLGICPPHAPAADGRAQWRAQWRIATDVRRTEDEYVVLLFGLLATAGLAPAQLTGAAISNVVPQIATTLERFARRMCGRQPVVIRPGLDTGLEIAYQPPEDVGPDRIANAVAARRFYGAPAIVVDYGTATTFDALSADGVYLGGAIAPGIGISVEALARHAARLSRVDLLPPAAAVGNTTVESVRSGILLGFAEQTDGMVRRFREEIGGDPVVIATGGLAETIAPLSRSIVHLDPWLTLEGLRLVWERAHPVATP